MRMLEKIYPLWDLGCYRLDTIHKKMEKETDTPGSIPSVFGALRGANIVMPLITTLLKEKEQKLTISFILIIIIIEKTVISSNGTLNTISSSFCFVLKVNLGCKYWNERRYIVVISLDINLLSIKTGFTTLFFFFQFCKQYQVLRRASYLLIGSINK